jgi:alcohol dehydrogenase
MLQGLFATEDNGGQKVQEYYRNGSWAEKVLVPVENVHPIPEELLNKFGVAKLTQINVALVPYGGFLSGGLEPGQKVMIQPATGHFGAAGVAVAIAMGATVYAVGRNSSILNSLVEKLGKRVIPVPVKGTEEDKSVYDKLQVDMILNIYPRGAPVENVAWGFEALKPGGTLVLMGGIHDDIALSYEQVMQKNTTVKGQFMFHSSAVGKMIELVQGGLLDLDIFEEKTFKLDEILDAVKYAASEDNRGWLYSTVLEI